MQNVPLDNGYKHTIYFDTKEKQEEYFFGKTKFTLTKQSYQRVERGMMKVEIPAESLYNCNYLMFKNTNFGEQPNNRWFYAFITGVEYINNAVSQVTFELDVMQTWFFDVTLLESFVEREHCESENIGSNIQSEPVSLGEYVISDYDVVDPISDMLVLIMIADEDVGTGGNLYEGIYGGCDIWAYNSDDTVNITAKVQSYIQKPDQIVSMYMCPKILIPDVPTGGKHLSYSLTSSGITKRLPSPTADDMKFDGYRPKNLKLYTYPYNFLRIDNASGQSLNLRYEFFDSRVPVIEITGTFLSPVKLVLRPCSYKGLPSYTELGGYTSSKSECITLENYPMCSWNVDTFKAWLAQNSVPIAINTLGSVVTSGLSTMMGEQSDATGASGISKIFNVLSQTYTASIAADQCRGNISNGNVNVSRGYQQFYMQRCHVSREYAMIIDDFFSVYGYATNKIKVPNRKVRPHWTYTKTIDCNIEGNAPADDVSRICSIYDAGITFWRNGDEVGNYSLNNQPS